MEDPKLIATLIPTDAEKRAEKAFRLKHNESRYLKPTEGIPEGPPISSREATPATELSSDEGCNYESTHRIQLTSGKKPKDPTKGYTFGTNEHLCDVLLGHRGAHRISGVHFCITFDEKKQLILKDCSTRGTSVSYNGQARGEVRRRFTWILDLRTGDAEYEIKVHVGGLEFKVELASHDACSVDFEENVERFLEATRTVVPALDVLGIYSHTTTAQPSQALTPRGRSIYIFGQTLGSGSFGRVEKVIDVSTGSTYARKQFYEPRWERNENRRRQQKEDWLNGVRKEIRIMRENPHEHTVGIVDFQDESPPFLVMPYFPLGNLQDLSRESRITEEETVDLLLQALKALEYLHARRVAHRDLKPENVLVESRHPFSIKLADFGLAKDTADLETFCGTLFYAAPEIYLKGKYTNSVDLWSLGVIILQYAYTLPEAVRRKQKFAHSMTEEWGIAWCRRIVHHANDWDSDGLIDLLTAGMLRMKPEERFSAAACLEKGYDLGLFEDDRLESGNATPTQSALPDETSDEKDARTIVLGALWRTADMSDDDDGSRAGGSYCPEHTSRVLKPGSLQVARTPSHGDDCTAQLGWHKRQRSPAVGSPQESPRRDRIKRQQPEARLSGISVSRNYGLSDVRSEHRAESNQFHTMYDAVLALLTDLLQPGDRESQDIDNRTRILIGEICGYLTRLHITGMRLATDDLSGNMTVRVGVDGAEIVLASLTPSELESSATDLAAHLLHMLRLQRPQLPNAPMAPVGGAPLQTDVVAQDAHSQNQAIDDRGSPTTTSSSQQEGVTYPSALLDLTNVSGCSLPVSR